MSLKKKPKQKSALLSMTFTYTELFIINNKIANKVKFKSLNT